MGSAALYQLSRRGARVLGIDRFAPPHDLGSSHGETRITRLAIGEGGHYTPLVKRSHEIWREIEKQTSADLLTQCGELILSGSGATAHTHVPGFFQNTIDAARCHGVAHELLDAAQIRARFPQFNIRDDAFAYFEPEAGFLRPEACVAAELSLAERQGAELRRNEAVLDFDAAPGGVSVRTGRGTYSADKIVLCVGAWLPALLGGDFDRLLKLYRQVLYWFDVEPEAASSFAPQNFPVFIWELPDAQQGIYGFPVVDRGLKIATEQYAQTTTPEAADRGVTSSEISQMHVQYVAPYLRGVTEKAVKAAACLYTVTPDAGFIVDRLPESERVVVASCCSGHGFKHSAAIGEALADAAQGRQGSIGLTPFRLARFSA